MPWRAGKSWRAVTGRAFVADDKSEQAGLAVMVAIQENASSRCFDARAFAWA